MLTPQEVSTRAFAKSMMGGYNMSAVDEFLDELTDDYTNLYKENATLKAKLKVLVEKVEEYRATEDSMRATLLTAQRMADSIVREAEAKRDQVLQEARNAARDQISDSQRELEEAEQRLRRGQEEMARFIMASRELCQKQVEFLDRLPHVELSPVSAQPAAEKEVVEAVRSVFPEAPEVPAEAAASPEAVTAAAEAPARKAAAQTEIPPAAEEPAPAEAAAPPEDDIPASELFGTVEEATRRINLEELKFGRNYSGGQEQ